MTSTQDDELVEQFRQERDVEYGALVTDVRRTQHRWVQSKRPPSRAVVQRDLRKLRERLTTIAAIDYFSAAGASTAKDAISALQRSVDLREARRTDDSRLDREDFRGRTWVTRPRPGIDRMASAWLVRRFVASDARFAFTSPPKASPAGRVPFDMPDVEFGHQGTDCTFETLVRRFGLNDPAVERVGQVVHDLDLKESRYGLPECVATGRLVEGLREILTNDHELLERGMLMIEALYRSFVREAATPEQSRKTRRRRSRGEQSRRQ